MKNFKWLALAACLTIVLAAPALAIDGSFKGTYEVWGVSNDHEDLTDASATNSWLQMLLDLNLNFQINDNLTLITRFEALDKKWGKTQDYNNIDVDFTAQEAIYEDGGNFTWQEAFLIAKTKIGGFVIGRMPDGPWGTNFGDTVGPADRFNWVVPIDKWRFAFTYEKWYEFDSQEGPTLAALGLPASMYDQSDGDNDKYYLSAQYKSEDIKTGLLGAFYRVRTFQDLGGGNEWYMANVIANYVGAGGTFGAAGPTNQALWNGTAAGVWPVVSATGAPFEGDAYVLSPYFIGKFGDLDVQAELTYAWGSGNYDDANKVLGATGFTIPDRDLETYAYNVEATYHLGPLSFTGGYAFVRGDELGSDDDDKITSYGLFEEGGDFVRGFILHDADYSGLDQSLGGGIGNLSGGAKSATCISGYKQFYVGLDYAVLDNLTLSALYAKSEAESPIDRKAFNTGAALNPLLAGLGFWTQPGEKWDSDHGSEYDFILTWKIFDNLEYKFIAAYLDAGDFWKMGDANAEVEDLFTVFNLLRLKF